MPGSATPRRATETPGAALLALRLLVAYGLLVWLAQRHGRALVELLLPLIQTLIGILDDQHRISSLIIGSEGADNVVRMTATQVRPIVMGGQVSMPHPLGLATVTTTVGNLLQIPVISLGLALAWPAGGVAERTARLGIVLLLMTPAVLLDAPFTLWASLWDIYVQGLDPDRLSPLLFWQRFLNSGGRLAIGAALGVAAIALARCGYVSRLRLNPVGRIKATNSNTMSKPMAH